MKTKRQADQQAKKSKKAEKAEERAQKTEQRRQKSKHAGGDGSANKFKSTATVHDSDDDMTDDNRQFANGELADEDMIDHDQPVSSSQLEDDPNDQLENEGYKTPGRLNASHLTVGAEANAFIQAEC